MSFDHYLKFLNECRLNHEAVNELVELLQKEGFKEIKEEEKWSLSIGGKYYLTKNQTSLLAFRMGRPDNGFILVGSHSDSPGFRIKTNPDMTRSFVQCLNTEVYGGPLLSTWFDRPLSIGGKVCIQSEERPGFKTVFYRSPKGVAIIPSVAIHMNREANKGVEINPQQHTLPVVSLDQTFSLLHEVQETVGGKILSHELYLICDEEARRIGFDRALYCSGRIDNLGNAYAGVAALIGAQETQKTAVVYVADNEEIGSMTKQGAQSAFLKEQLKRIVYAQGGDFQMFRQALARSFMISADQAHAVHPNYGEYADPTNQPQIGHGPVIKIAANGAYTSDAESIAQLKVWAQEAEVPLQTFVNRSDKRGGSTIAAITTTHLDIPIVDIGNPMWGMHSAIETAGVEDQGYMEKLMKKSFEG